ncbi:MAG: alpha/beta hydrolase [Vicinamibacterales bacterium]
MERQHSGWHTLVIAIGSVGGMMLLPGPRPISPAFAAPTMEMARYDPTAEFEITVTDVEFRRNAAGRMLMARVYRPVGTGPFPAVLDLHGGAWNAKDRLAEEPMDRSLAQSGLLVVAVDMTLAKEAPYPAAVQDANYAVRWLKWKAPSWNGDTSRLGVYGSSSGGHVAELLAMRPREPRYNAIPLPDAQHVDARISWAAMRSPISDTAGRLQHARRRGATEMVTWNTNFFVPLETIHEGNPQAILERREPITIVPMLIMCGSLDDNVLPQFQHTFAASYAAAGGNMQCEVFEGAGHEWTAEEGPLTDRAREMVKTFIARHVNG